MVDVWELLALERVHLIISHKKDRGSIACAPRKRWHEGRGIGAARRAGMRERFCFGGSGLGLSWPGPLVSGRGRHLSFVNQVGSIKHDLLSRISFLLMTGDSKM